MFFIVPLHSQFLNASAPINASGTFEATSIILIAIAMSQILATHLSITYLGFPAQSLYPPTTVGRVAETEWAPFRGSATQNWFEKCIRKTKKLQIFCPTSVALLVYSFFRIFAIHTERVFEVPRIFNERCTLDFRFDIPRDNNLTSLT